MPYDKNVIWCCSFEITVDFSLPHLNPVYLQLYFMIIYIMLSEKVTFIRFHCNLWAPSLFLQRRSREYSPETTNMSR